MNTLKFRGVIIKEVHFKEADKILTIFSKEYGKIQVGAKGAKNAKSKFLVAQLFAYCDFVVYKGRQFYTLTQVDLIESFYPLRLDYDRLDTAYQIVKQIDRWTIGEFLPGETEEILLLLLKSLIHLCKDHADYALIFLVFGFKFLQITGFSPQIEGVYLYTDSDKIRLSETSAYVIAHILTTEITKVFNFNLEKNMVKELTLLYNKVLPILELE